MADPAFSYESDIAPQKGSYFSDVPRSGSGSPYSAINILRSASQKATKRVEDEELKRRNEELEYQRNRFILQEGKDAAKLEADRLAMEPALNKKLEDINALIDEDPVKAQKALLNFVSLNQSTLGDSKGLQAVVSQMNSVLNSVVESRTQKESDSDDSASSQALEWAGLDSDKASAAIDQIKDPYTKAKVAAAVASTVARGQLSRESDEAKAEEAQKKEARTDEQRKNAARFNDLKSMTPAPPGYSSTTPGSPVDPTKFKLKPQDKIRAIGYAKSLGIDPNLEDEELYSTVVEQLISLGIDETPIGGRVGGVTEGMLPSSP
jgi:hypothetical protein